MDASWLVSTAHWQQPIGDSVRFCDAESFSGPSLKLVQWTVLNCANVLCIKRCFSLSLLNWRPLERPCIIFHVSCKSCVWYDSLCLQMACNIVRWSFRWSMACWIVFLKVVYGGWLGIVRFWGPCLANGVMVANSFSMFYMNHSYVWVGYCVDMHFVLTILWNPWYVMGI